LGNAPVTQENVPVGEHIVQAMADGYETSTQTITIEAGRQRSVNMHLVEAARRPGRIVVNANVDRARVWVDGNDMGAPPVVIGEATAGTHAIIVRAEGHQEFRSTCTVAPEQDCQVTATLEPMGTPVRIEANVRGAQFYLDGQLQGPVPWEGIVPVGQHLVEVRATGYRPHVEQVSLRVAAQTRSFVVTLVGENELTAEELRELERERQRGIHQAVSHSAAVLPEDLALMDISVGWPYLGEFRLGVGLHRYLEAGVAFRSFGILNEFEARVKAGYRVSRALSVGGQGRIGGGIGPARDALDSEGPSAESHSTNAFFMSAEALISLHFAHAGAATFFAGVDFHSDRWDWLERDRRTLAGPSGDIDRQNIGRGRFGGAIEFTLNKRMNIWGMFEGVVGEGRRMLGHIYGAGRH
ncbi:MAG: PEGA domain-containing protein, partial [Polyangiaceae bacterium]|nr:PEGA domain-containing protein [Polyangiaceae bacterium]